MPNKRSRLARSAPCGLSFDARDGYARRRMQRKQADYRRIAERLRARLIAGDFPAGSRFPTTRSLAARYRSTTFTVHMAIVSLVREGWLERINGRATYVAQHKPRFRNVGLYYGADVWTNEFSQFLRSVHLALASQLETMGKDIEIFTDHRPTARQETVLPNLAVAVAERRIDCLIAPSATHVAMPTLAKLTVPLAFLGSRRYRHSVGFSHEDFLRTGLDALASRGCRTVGLISTIWDDTASEGRLFRKLALQRNLKTHNRWISLPPEVLCHYPAFGYESFLRLWAEPEKPDGLIVFSDLAARGVISAAQSCGPVAFETMKFAFHRNLGSYQICPTPVSWIVSDEGLTAAALIQMVEAQFTGQRISRLTIPYSTRFESMP